MHRFYWVIEGGLAGCSLPGGSGQGGDRREAGALSQEATSLDADLAWLRRQEIGAILSLTEGALPRGALERHGLATLHIPVPDMTAPLPEQVQRALDFIDLQCSNGRAVAVHCLMGQGRTGAILASYLIRSGMTAGDAVAHLRAICPGALAGPDQESSLHAFATRREWVL